MMNMDPRPVANAILDIADEVGVSLSNFHLNKVLFFAHSESLALCDKPLFKLTFEAWEHGPVLPVIYHQFKEFGSNGIRGRATQICRETGDRIPSSYEHLELDYNFLRRIVETYGALSFSALYALAHQPGGAWDTVWNQNNNATFGMTMPNKLIKDTFSGRLGEVAASSSDSRRGSYVQ